MMRKVKSIVKRVLPPGTRGFRVAQAVGRAAGVVPRVTDMDVAYAEWIRNSEPHTVAPPTTFTYRPLISIVVPVFNAPDYYLLPMVHSVVNQTYDNWELVMVNACTRPELHALTESCQYIDKRIKLVTLNENKGIARNTNDGIAACRGEYIVLFDHDDLLAPHALSEVVRALQGKPEKRPQFIYSDEDKLSENGEHRFDPHFKPDWSPELLKNVNYLNHLTVMEAGLLKKAGGFRTGFEGAQDYDLYLRILDKHPRVTHIPKVLYHWRAARSSTAQNFSVKKGVTDSGVRALQEHLKRNKQQGEVKAIPKKPGFYRLSYTLPANAKASILLFPAADIDQQRNLLEEITHSLSANEAKVQIITAPAGHKELEARKDVQVIDEHDVKPFLKKALAAASGEFVIGVNAGVIPKNKDWIDRLCGLLYQDTDVGVVGPLLLDKASKTILDAGYIEDEGQLRPLFEKNHPGTHTYFGNNDWSRNVQALSGRVWAAKTTVAKKYSSDAHFPLHYGKMLQDDLRIVFWPFVRLYYYGDLQMPDSETAYFSRRLHYTHGQIGLTSFANLPERRSEK